MSLAEPGALTGEGNRAQKAKQAEQNVANDYQHKAEGIVGDANRRVEVEQWYFKLAFRQALSEQTERKQPERAEDQTADQRKAPVCLGGTVPVQRLCVPLSIHIPFVRGKILPNA
jgi:hypothetical protein